MNEHPLSQTSMRRSLAKPPPPPASSCANCFRPGIISSDQTNRGGRTLDAIAGIRFECVCGATWTVSKDAAKAHGAFLQRINHTHQRGDI